MKTCLKISLLSHSPEPEKIIAAAAKLCYSNVGTKDILNGLNPEATDKFLNMLISMGHMSPVEHATFTFAAEGVSRSLTHQLVRHRIASYSQKSQRYVREGQFEYIVPPAIAANAAALAVFEQSMLHAQASYDNIADCLKETYLKKYLAAGKNPKAAASAAEKKAIEDARYVLPNACETKIIFTMNARELIHFCRQRSCERAQWEIREMSEKMIVQLKTVAPTLFQLAGPPCLYAPCPEGAMSCGKTNEKRAQYGVISQK
ncbi:MAG: FAD-dependent thymidylate synthase [Eubacteriaceae bacterium]|nr:FAD-dependent thymidylate synthase [Eubacteriaceae bacterium]